MHFIQRKIGIFAILVSLGFATTAQADELVLKNGSIIVGKLVSSTADKVVYDTPFAGRISIKQENIVSISTDGAVTLKMKDGAVYKSSHILTSEDEVMVKTEAGSSVRINPVDIEKVNPEPWEIGEGYKWSGRVMLAVEFERGNSDTDEWAVDVESIWRSLVDRYTLEGDLEYEEKNGERTENEWNLLGKYDRFLAGDPKNYRGVKVLFEHDEFEDLDLRITAGPYVGRQFFDSDRLKLQAELGPVYVNEDFDEAPDDNWWGASWVLKAESDVVGFDSTLYLKHDGTQNLDETSDLILNTTIGIRFPLLHGFETAFEAEYEYDGGAVEGVDEVDKTYNWKIGYGW